MIFTAYAVGAVIAGPTSVYWYGQVYGSRQSPGDTLFGSIIWGLLWPLALALWLLQITLTPVVRRIHAAGIRRHDKDKANADPRN